MNGPLRIPGLIAAALLAALPVASGATLVSGAKHLIVLRAYFHDYTATSRYTQAQVQTMFGKLDTLWGTHSSYGNITLDQQVSTLFQLPSNRSTYIDTPPDAGGDLSSGGKYQQVLNDAVANAPSGLNWSNVDGVVVIMAETDASKFHRGQGNKCNLNMGPGSSTIKLVGCAIFSENPGSTDIAVWGRWAPEAKYFVITPATGGATRGLYAEEYAPGSKPNAQAIKAYITGVGSAYYLISARRRVLGDDLRDAFTPPGLPDEGVLIERVTENTDPWVTIQGNPDRDKLWHEGQLFHSVADGMYISIDKKADSDDYIVTVRYSDNANKPDVGINSWLQPPGNTYETTDIWVDSPVNGYGTFKYPTWSDGLGGTVPSGNGDDPAIGQVNRLYARVRNYGTVSATNVVVHFDVTSPLGLGINGSNGFVLLGTVTSADFPGLATIPPGGHTDVFINWTPNATLTPQQIAQGTFAFHSCVRVRIDHLPGETIFGNQDGNGQQENIGYFEAPAAGSAAPGAPHEQIITLHNDDKLHPKFFNLSYDRSKVPAGWKVVVNHNDFGVQLGPDGIRKIPVTIVPSVPMTIGRSAAVEISASSLRLLTSDRNPKDQHPEFKTLGGVIVVGHAVAPVKLGCAARRNADGIAFEGRIAVGVA